MDLEFGLILLCSTVLAVFDLLSGPKKRLSPRKWLLNRLTRAGREGTLGPPRLKTFCGELYVVGCGRRYPVRTKNEGFQLMARMKHEMDKTLEALPPGPPGQECKPILLL